MNRVTEMDPREYLQRYAGHTVDFYRFPGNYGDSLIWHGTMRLLTELTITVHEVTMDNAPNNAVLLIDGGGNFVDEYTDVKDFLVNKGDAYREVLILPHSIKGEAQAAVLNALAADVTVFCRERVSAAFLAERLYKAKVYIWHDCAFYNVMAPVAAGSGILYAFRCDKESVRSDLPVGNIDLSYDGWAKKPLDTLVAAMVPFAEVHTDRLHLGILGALLGKQVRLFPNSYYKNQAVFDYSLSRFSNVVFKCGDE